MKKSVHDESEDIRKKKTDAAKKAADKDTGKTAADTDNLPERGAVNEETDEQSLADANEAARMVDQELFDVKDRYMRLLAEYDNFRRRSQKERESLYTDAVADISKEWLLVVDNIERAMAFAGNTSEENADKLSEGVAMIYKQAVEVLSKLGIEEILSETGSAFDPNLHAAVTHIEDDSLGEQVIAQVFQKGYKKGSRVIRHTLVQVAN